MFYSDQDSETTIVSDINMVPLIDIMLVLLVVFMITIPMLTSSIEIQMPQESSIESKKAAQPVEITITSAGDIYLDDAIHSQQELSDKFKMIAQEIPQPAVHLRADKLTSYEKIMSILAEAKHKEISSIGFVFKQNH